MPWTPREIGRVYRESLAERFSPDLGNCRIRGSWLEFGDRRILVRYSKFHPQQNKYWYGIEKRDWSNWEGTDHLAFLLPPRGYADRISDKVDYILLPPQDARKLLARCNMDYRNQKKVNIFRKSRGLEIHELPTYVSSFTVESLKVKVPVEPSWGIDHTDRERPTRKPPRVIKGRGRRARGHGRRYLEFNSYLTEIDRRQKQIALTFDEFIEIAGVSLPESSRKIKYWWVRISKSWGEAGWELQDAYPKAEIIVLRRRGSNPLRMIPQYVRDVLGGKQGKYLLDSQTLSEWLRFCRRVAWYFEGTVLYERTSVDLDGLGEIERHEVEEDYAVCKRELLRGKNALHARTRGRNNA